MKVTINKGTAFGRVVAPPSKSMAHRYLICGALSEESVISGISYSADIKATLSCLEGLGANVEICGDTVKIGGLYLENTIKSDKLFCNESGSTLRFLIPLCLLTNKKITLMGSERLFERSLSVYEDLCKAQNIDFSKQQKSVKVCGKLSAGKYSVRGDVSSQFISGLMFALPNLTNDSLIDITGALESGSYLGLTVKALADFGIRISRIDEHTIYIKGGQRFKNRKLTVEGDYSNAAFFAALNTLGGNVAISNLKKNSCQGDMVYKELLENLYDGRPSIDVSDCPDLAPILMAVAAAKNGAEFTGTKRLKIKESDRAATMAEELLKFGCKVDVKENSVTVHKCKLKTPTLPLYGHNDHRIVMAVSVLATLTGGTVYGAEAVEKSFPDFFLKLASLGIDLKVEN